MNIFLTTLKQELEKQDISQRTLAESTDISVNTIRGWFAKDLVPDVFKAQKIAQYLNTTVEFLVTGKEVDGYKTKYDNLVQAIKQLPFD